MHRELLDSGKSASKHVLFLATLYPSFMTIALTYLNMKMRETCQYYMYGNFINHTYQEDYQSFRALASALPTPPFTSLYALLVFCNGTPMAICIILCRSVKKYRCTVVPILEHVIPTLQIGNRVFPRSILNFHLFRKSKSTRHE